MQLKKTYYSISEVSKILDIPEHTIRFWESKIPDLSLRSEKGKTRFFNEKQISMLSKINNLLKNNDTLSLAFDIVSKKNSKKSSLNFNNLSTKEVVSNQFKHKINQIRTIANNLRTLIIEK